MDLGPGSVIADYEIVAEIGRGGMAVVYEAIQKRLKRAVALKILPDFFSASEDWVVRFRREAEAGARLQHPNIVQVYETGRTEQIHFIAMELVRGRSLANLLDETRRKRDALLRPAAKGDEQTRKRLDAITATTDRLYIERIARTMVDVLRGLEHAHAHGVVHRDIKPQNLLLDADGRVRIADFGLARLLEDPAFSRVGEHHGTPWYMSPEQVAVGSVPIDHRTDIFSTGVTLYEMLTLERPFPGDDVTTVFRQILHKDPPSLRTINPRLPRDLQTIVLKSLEKDPGRRYQSASEFADDLERFLSYQDIRARPVGRLGHLLRMAARNKAFAAIALALVVVVAGVLVRLGVEDARRRSKAAEMLKEAEVHRATGAFDREAAALGELLRHVDPDHAEARRRLAAAGESRRAEAERAVADAQRLVLERRFERARAVLEHALRMMPEDARALRLYEEAAGIRKLRLAIEGGPARVWAAEYAQVRRSREKRTELGSGALVEAALPTGDYVVTAVAADGRFAECWVSVDPQIPVNEIALWILPPEEATRNMVRIPAGLYKVGEDGNWFGGATPRGDVALDAFWIDEREATHARFDRYVAHLRRAGRPLPPLPQAWRDGVLDPAQAEVPIQLEWMEACEFLAWEGKRLPTEAEWEVACAGDRGPYAWGRDWDASKANVATQVVANAGAHGGEGFAFGLFDMIGNVWEWTADRYVPYPGFVPFDPATAFREGKLKEGEEMRFARFDAAQRVVRGGSYQVAPTFATATFRYAMPPDGWGGIRGVRSDAPPGGGE